MTRWSDEMAWSNKEFKPYKNGDEIIEIEYESMFRVKSKKQARKYSKKNHKQEDNFQSWE